LSKLSSGLIWTSLLTVASALGDAILVIVVSHLLTPGQVGLVAVATISMTFAQWMGNCGFGAAIVQAREENAAVLSTGLLMSLLSGLLLGGALLLGSNPVATAIHLPQVAGLLTLSAILFPVWAYARCATDAISKEHRFRLLSILECSSSILYVSLACYFAKTGYGPSCVVYASLGQALWLAISCTIFLRRSVFVSPRIEILGKLARPAGAYLGSQFLNLTAGNVDTLLVGRLLGATSLGYYSRAYNLTARPALVIGNSCYKWLFPTASKHVGDQKKMSELLLKSVSVVSLGVLPLSALIAICSPEIVRVVLGNNWVAATSLFEIFAVAMYFRACAETCTALARAGGLAQAQLLPKIIYFLLVVLLVPVGSAIGRVNGAAIGVVFANIVHFAVVIAYGCHQTATSAGSLFRAQIKSLALAILVAASGYLVLTLLRAHNFNPLLNLLGVMALELLVGAVFVYYPRVRAKRKRQANVLDSSMKTEPKEPALIETTTQKPAKSFGDS
jgi:PST family polysaccharide transporter